ncbi:DNA helicase [Saccharomycopsis crataegensis]|uniref:ATP-dependent DNA helicase PIF1 n=1 Tax=Saccharomycopsis crataegensis TaxID=43959 RepID=A0AAV5QKF6_9ASCO|nr:DNA helicase [Saccharomycopsis crataegensis]
MLPKLSYSQFALRKTFLAGVCYKRSYNINNQLATIHLYTAIRLPEVIMNNVNLGRQKKDDFASDAFSSDDSDFFGSLSDFELEKLDEKLAQKPSGSDHNLESVELANPAHIETIRKDTGYDSSEWVSDNNDFDDTFDDQLALDNQNNEPQTVGGQRISLSQRLSLLENSQGLNKNSHSITNVLKKSQAVNVLLRNSSGSSYKEPQNLETATAKLESKSDKENQIEDLQQIMVSEDFVSDAFSDSQGLSLPNTIDPQQKNPTKTEPENINLRKPSSAGGDDLTQPRKQNLNLTPGTQNDHEGINIDLTDPSSPDDHRWKTTGKRFVITRSEQSMESPTIPMGRTRAPVIISSPTQHLTQRPSVSSPLANGKSAACLASRKMSTATNELPSSFVAEIVLSEEQNKILEIIKQGHNVFYTGSAGTGKSVLLRHAIKELRSIHGHGAVAVTASTGLAACNIGGTTLHSFSGIGLGEATAKQLIKKVKRSKKSCENWRRTKVLFIDEISMVDGRLLDKLSEIAKAVRKSQEPFGGIQVIFCGDFYQLPPVSKRTYNMKGDTKEEDANFAFTSESWKESIKVMVIMTKIFRQKGDLDFIDMLNEMRNGELSTKTIHNFLQLRRPLPTDDGIEPAELFATRYEVDRANNRRLSVLPGEEYVFNSIDGGSMVNGDSREALLNNFLAPKQLILKAGAQVMMIKNMDETLVNGSLGKVIDFVDPDTYFFYKKVVEDDVSDDEKFEAAVKRRTEKPTKFTEKHRPKLLETMEEEATKHELDESVFDFFKVMKEDENIDPILKANIDRKKNLINKLYDASKKRRYPLVRFLVNDGNTRDVLVNPETWDIEDENEQPLVSRTQIPLMLAWSISIHKSQGQTLSKAKVDLRKVFEKGQAYVALSRVTARKGLQVLNFVPTKVMTHLSVKEFYDALMNPDQALERARKLAESPAFSMKQFYKMEPPKKREAAQEAGKRGRKKRSPAPSTASLLILNDLTR